MVTINSLYFEYTKGINILEEIGLTLNKGNIYGLLGKNGEGKTTLLKCISGLCIYNNGEITINAKNIDENKEKIFYVPDEIYFPKIKLKNYKQLLKIIYPNFDESIFLRYLKEFNLNENMMLTYLSSGQNKKIIISIALSSGADILLLDEPTNSMDIMSKKIFKKMILEECHSQKIIVISTHQTADIENIISDLIVLDSKNIIFQKSINDIVDNLDFNKNINDIKPEDIVYTNFSSLGNETISKRISKEIERNINIELLYEALIKDNNKVNKIFK